ncbi:uncharacterized protein [Nicotiana tomentosiformis]|uniref:uncharacterized protein n=1 Tax=Nicotiana tomentosiformis TaxID=4098 RepID=UPI00388C685C
MASGRGRGRDRAKGRGRVRGRGRAQSRARAAAPVVKLQVDLQEEVPVQNVPVGPVQVPEGFIVTLILQDALVRLVSLMEDVAQNGTFPVAPTISQAGGRAQTLTTPTPAQMAPQNQAPAASPVGEVVEGLYIDPTSRIAGTYLGTVLSAILGEVPSYHTERVIPQEI